MIVVEKKPFLTFLIECSPAEPMPGQILGVEEEVFWRIRREWESRTADSPLFPISEVVTLTDVHPDMSENANE